MSSELIDALIQQVKDQSECLKMHQEILERHKARIDALEGEKKKSDEMFRDIFGYDYEEEKENE